MTVTPYIHEQHYELVKTWLAARGIPVPAREFFYECGFVVGGVAIGFVVKTAPAQAFIDHLVADPNIDASLRDEAIRFLATVLEKKAKEMGATFVVGFAKIPSMKSRMEEIGYTPYGDYTLYYKTLALPSEGE